MKRIYFDRAAAGPVSAEVLEAMLPYFREDFGNPSSLHAEGRRALDALDNARGRVASLVGADEEEIYFTSSGSEANNLAVKGLAGAMRSKGDHMVISAVEHASVINSVRALERAGFRVTTVPVDAEGRVAPAAVEAALTPKTVLVSVMTANNEVGTLEPVEGIAAVCRARGVLFHTDAVAAAGSIPINVKASGVDSLSLAGDQFQGPKGAAALYVRKGLKFTPIIDGGNQESGRRAGTENVPAIVGLGRAAEFAAADMAGRNARLAAMRDRLLDEVPRRVEHVLVTGPRERRLPNQASFCVKFVEGESMLLGLDIKGVSVASGSACTSKALRASHVLLAMGIDHATAQGSIVFTLHEGNTPEDVEHFLDIFPPIVERLRLMSPLYTEFLKNRG